MYNQWFSYTLTKNRWISYFSPSCNITNNNDVTDINKSGQGNIGSVSNTTKSKLHIKVRQVDGGGRLHTPQHLKHFAKTNAHLFLLVYKLL